MHGQVPRFHAPQLPSSIGASIALPPDEARHAARVLRLAVGSRLELCDGRGRLVAAEVCHVDKASVLVASLSEPLEVRWQGPQWLLGVGCLTLKGGRADWLVEKATELGAHSLQPLLTQRSQAAGKNKFRTRQGGGGREAGGGSHEAVDADDFTPAGRLERLAVAASKQSLRVHGLRLLPPAPLAAVLGAVRGAPLSLVATAGAPPVAQVLRGAVAARGDVSTWQAAPCPLLVGPEGDFTPEELDSLVAAGALPVGLGPNRLRTETAALALLAAAMLLVDSSHTTET